MIYFNGEFTEDESICSDRGFNYGIGCFETIMGTGRKLVFFEEHLTRLKNSMKYLGIKQECDWHSIIEELIRFNNINEIDEYSVKIVTTDKKVMISLKKIQFRDEPSGIKLKVIRDMYQNEMGFIKSTNYAANVISMEKLRKEGYYEGIFKNRCGIVTEGTISNLFFIKNSIIHTPSLSLNILPGIVRTKIFEIAEKESIEVIEGEFDEELILNSDSIFISNSLMKKGILWANEIEGLKKEKNKILEIIEQKYIEMIDELI